jgi:hypothetical protein
MGALTITYEEGEGDETDIVSVLYTWHACYFAWRRARELSHEQSYIGQFTLVTLVGIELRCTCFVWGNTR